MPSTMYRRLIIGLLIFAGAFGGFAFISQPGQHAAAGTEAFIKPSSSSFDYVASSLISETVFLPLVVKNYPWLSSLGVEPNSSLLPGSTLLTRTIDSGSGWVRLNARISWRNLQPNEGDPIQWGLLSKFENELRALRSAGIKPIVIVDDHPYWATINDVRQDGQPTSCGPLRTDKFSAFAEFVRSLVSRYKTSEFNVRDWELGNEPDVDPDLVPTNSVFGCWGDIDDPYYNGEHYGEMLKVVSPAIKAEDPGAQVWIGGLLLDNPNTPASKPGNGSPELFLQGILEAGAAPYFDIVPYHSYPPYLDERIDYDNALAGPWKDLGGGIVGKASFLRQLMSPYGVDKPVFLNETGLMCPPTIGGEQTTWCSPPEDAFYQMQADHVVRSFVRGISANISGFIWYTIDGPGWRYTGLLDGSKNPLPGYTAFQQLNTRLQYTKYSGPADYGASIEAYAFTKDDKFVHVIWSKADETHTIVIPSSKFVAAYKRDGTPLTPAQDGSLQVGFEPIYVELLP